MISSKDALANIRANSLSRWTKTGSCANKRIEQRICIPGSTQSFECDPADSIFAIGSCFARNVEERLELAGADVLSRHIDVQDLGAGSARVGGMFNKYNPVTILQELRWAAGEEPFPEAGFLPTGERRFYDAHLRKSSGNADKEALKARRLEIRDYFAQAFNADLVIVTLGLTEAWYDHETGHYVNEAPPGRVMRSDRFGFEVLGHETCLDTLERIHSLLQVHGKPGQKMLITVSPVPLNNTFTEEDVMVANMTSKTTLRSAAHPFCSTHERVDYFPSFEAVLHSDPMIVWEGDRRHVTDFMVGQIIQAFLERYGFVASREITTNTPESIDETSEQAIIRKLKHEARTYKEQIIKLEKQAKLSR